MKRIAIPESDTNWTISLSDALNLSEITLYGPVEGNVYHRFEEVEEAFDAGIRFRLEFCKEYEGHLANENYPFLWALADMHGNMECNKLDWKLHATQPTIKMMYMKLQET